MAADTVGEYLTGHDPRGLPRRARHAGRARAALGAPARAGARRGRRRAAGRRRARRDGATTRSTRTRAATPSRSPTCARAAPSSSRGELGRRGHAWRSWSTRSGFGAYPDAVPALRALRDRGLKPDRRLQLGLLARRACSSAAGSRAARRRGLLRRGGRPQARSRDLRARARARRVRGREALHVGDTAEEDVDGRRGGRASGCC